MKEKHTRILIHNSALVTPNLAPGKRVYGEKLLNIQGKEFREWNPFRSKLAAGIKNGLKQVPLAEGNKVLYLGVAEGTTASHISDIVGEKGVVFGVDISERTMRKLLQICDDRENIVPVVADAGKPEEYAEYLEEQEIDLLYQDVSQRDQASIFNKNAKQFLKKGKFGIIALKGRSISQKKNLGRVFATEVKELEKEFTILEKIKLEPFEKEHLLVLGVKK